MELRMDDGSIAGTAAVQQQGEETVFTSQVKYGQTITAPDLEIPESYFLYVGGIDEVVAKFKGGEGA